jgi:hypothetical protein
VLERAPRRRARSTSDVPRLFDTPAGAASPPPASAPLPATAVLDAASPPPAVARRADAARVALRVGDSQRGDHTTHAAAGAIPDRSADAQRGESGPREAAAAGAVPDRAVAPSRIAGPTLDDLLSAAWEGLREEALVDCPVCRGPMQPRPSAGAGVVGGRCGGCAAVLS